MLDSLETWRYQSPVLVRPRLTRIVYVSQLAEADEEERVGLPRSTSRSQPRELSDCLRGFAPAGPGA